MGASPRLSQSEYPILSGNSNVFRSKHIPNGLNRTRITNFCTKHPQISVFGFSLTKNPTYMFLIKWLFRMASSKWWLRNPGSFRQWLCHNLGPQNPLGPWNHLLNPLYQPVNEWSGRSCGEHYTWPNWDAKYRLAVCPGGKGNNWGTT